EKADYGYLTALAHSLTNKAMAEDDMIIYTLGYYKDHHVRDKLARTYLLAADYYRWNNDVQMRQTMLRGGLDLSLEMQDSAMIAQFYHAIGHDHYSKKEYREAIEFYRQAIAYQSSALLYYVTGLAFAFTVDADSMDFYINKAIHLSLLENEKDQTSHYLRNYADILYGQGKYHKALTIQKQLADEAENSRPVYVHTSIAQIYLALKQPDSARLYLDSARFYLDEIKQQTGMSYQTLTGDNFLTTLQAVIDYAKGKAVNMQPIGQANDYYWMKTRENELLIEEKINVKNRLEQHNLMLIVGRQRVLLYITWSLILFVLIVILMFIYLRRKQIKLIETEEKREVLEKLLKEATVANEKDSTFFKKVLLQQLGLIKLIASAPTSHNQDLLKQVSLINNKDLPTGDMLVWEDLYKLTDSIFDGFYTRITSRHGEILTEKEKQLCCLLCAGFSTKEISVITQQGTQTIYQRKTTIRQKLKMDEKEDIIDFIKA
ncbi:MAG: hypothetical protein LBF05_03810, partial [Tannerella sp.]|nr:hypothetical protein [Tannerella sp.]